MESPLFQISFNASRGKTFKRQTYSTLQKKGWRNLSLHCGQSLDTEWLSYWPLTKIAVTLWRWSGAAGSCPNKTHTDTLTQRRSSSQARCCEVAKVSGLRWSPCSCSEEQRIQIREVVYLQDKQRLSGVEMQWVEMCCIKFSRFDSIKLYFSGQQWDEQDTYELTKRRLTNLMMLLSV